MFIGCCQQFIGRELKILIKQNFPVLHIIHICTNLIHAISGIDSYHIVFTRFTESTKNKIDSLITAISQKDMFGIDFFDPGQLFFQITLQRIGIPVVWKIIRILISVQKYGSSSPLIFIPCRRIRLQLPNIGAG